MLEEQSTDNGQELKQENKPKANHRRQFLGETLKTVCGIGLLGMGLGSYSRQASSFPAWAIRPPGAINEEDFSGACIRCGLCNTVCPVELLPQQLYWFSKSENIEKAMDYNLLDCIECGCCSYVCPSNIPLVNYYQFSKALYKKQTQEKTQIEKARERFEFREMRLERNKRERAELMEAKKIALKEKMAKDKAQKEKIDAALERVNAAKIDNKEEDAS